MPAGVARTVVNVSLAVETRVAREAGTCVVAKMVLADPTMLARVAGTLVNVEFAPG